MREAPMIYQLSKPKHIEANKIYPALFVTHGMGSNEQVLSISRN